ncbi:MAG TPA: hypothetical protein VFW12_03015 [Candidatus Limnocylindria bacterium]|nr:hypothetical protein [Candidatus Limnocylindria bacterium]
MKPTRELRRSKHENERGRLELERVERLAPAERERIRAGWWRERRYLVVTPGDELTLAALAPFPARVREQGRRARFRRYDDRGGGGFWPDENEIWLAAGVETYESLAQVVMSARHELFHFVNWNDPLYRDDLDRGYPGFRAALAAARASRASGAGHGSHERYWSWIADSFVPQGDHANPVELWADIPTNFPDPAELPPPVAAYFAPLLVERGVPPALPPGRGADDGLPAFHELIAPGMPTRTP